MQALPVIYSAGSFDSESRFRSMTHSPERMVEQYELELYDEDGGVSRLNTREYPIRRGMLLIARPGDRRSSTLPFHNCFIRLGQVDEAAARLLDDLAGVTQLENYEPCEAAFRRISAWFLSDDPYNRAAAAAEVIVLLQMVHQQCAAQYQRASELSVSDVVAQALQYIELHYHEDIGVEEIARACHVSASYLHRMFIQHQGLTPHGVLTRRRIIAAKAMLINEPFPIAEVAWRCGFQSASYFSDCFRKWVGSPPRQFRKETGYQL